MYGIYIHAYILTFLIVLYFKAPTAAAPTSAEAAPAKEEKKKEESEEESDDDMGFGKYICDFNIIHIVLKRNISQSMIIKCISY